MGSTGCTGSFGNSLFTRAREESYRVRGLSRTRAVFTGTEKGTQGGSPEAHPPVEPLTIAVPVLPTDPALRETTAKNARRERLLA